MSKFTSVVIGFIMIITLVQLVFTYQTFKKFDCPDCPECPSLEDQEVLSNQSFVAYLKRHFINKLDDDVKSIDYLKFNVIFANNYIVNYEADAESIMSKIRNEFETNKSKYNAENLIYVQTTDESAKNQFLEKFNLTNYPTPLIYFNNYQKILFGHIDYEWKMLIDVTQFDS